MVLFCFASLSASAELTLIEAAEEHFAKGRYDQAAQRYQEIIKNPFAAPPDIAVAQCRAGVIKSIQNDQVAARRSLEDAIRGGGLPLKHSAICHYALLQIYVLDKAYPEARDIIRKMGDVQLTPIYVARTWALAAEVGARLEDSAFEVMYLQKLLQVMEKNIIDEVEVKILNGKRIKKDEIRTRLGLDATSRAPFPTAARTPVAASPAPQVQNSVARATPAARTPVAPTAAPVALNATGAGPVFPSGNAAPPSDRSVAAGTASVAQNLWSSLRNGDMASARARVEQGAQDRSLAASLREAGLGINSERLLTRLTRLQSDDPRNLRVGIVLPVGSIYTRVNSRILRSLSSFASSSAVKGVNYTFVVKAISPEPGAAETAAVHLILDDHVHAIVGPVSNSQVLGVQSAASLFAVPVFALGPVTASAELFPDNLVRMGLLAKSQARVLVKHLREDLRFRNAAVLASADPYGFEMSSAFQDVAKENAFPISSVTYYSPAADVFKDEVDVVIGPQNKASRKTEYDELLKKAKKKAQVEKKHFDPKRVLLPPVLNFDALFVPESLTKARMIASTFAFVGAEVVHYVGDRQWVEGANGRSSIADAFMNGSRVPVPANGVFLSYVRRDLGFGDNALDLERQAFDALMLLRTAQYRAGGNSTPKMLQVMRAADWSCEGIGLYGSVDASGEPAAKFSLAGYRGGKLDAQLPVWSIEDSSKALFELKEGLPSEEE